MYLFTDEELEILFPNKIQRDIFIKGMEDLMKEINKRTVSLPLVEVQNVVMS